MRADHHDEEVAAVMKMVRESVWPTWSPEMKVLGDSRYGSRSLESASRLAVSMCHPSRVVDVARSAFEDVITDAHRTACTVFRGLQEAELRKVPRSTLEDTITLMKSFALQVVGDMRGNEESSQLQASAIELYREHTQLEVQIVPLESGSESFDDKDIGLGEEVALRRFNRGSNVEAHVVRQEYARQFLSKISTTMPKEYERAVGIFYPQRRTPLNGDEKMFLSRLRARIRSRLPEWFDEWRTP